MPPALDLRLLKPMIVLSIVDRELRVASRRSSPYVGRLLIAGLAIGVGFFLYLANLSEPKHVLASRAFIGLSVVAFCYWLASGWIFAANSLSEEEREGTLGLLFLTSLRGYD